MLKLVLLFTLNLPDHLLEATFPQLPQRPKAKGKQSHIAEDENCKVIVPSVLRCS